MPEVILCHLHLEIIPALFSPQPTNRRIKYIYLSSCSEISSGRTDIYFIRKSRRKDVAMFPEHILALKMTEIITPVACII